MAIDKIQDLIDFYIDLTFLSLQSKYSLINNLIAKISN